MVPCAFDNVHPTTVTVVVLTADTIRFHFSPLNSSPTVTEVRKLRFSHKEIPYRKRSGEPAGRFDHNRRQRYTALRHKCNDSDGQSKKCLTQKKKHDDKTKYMLIHQIYFNSTESSYVVCMYNNALDWTQ